jgi:hypothetical protein
MLRPLFALSALVRRLGRDEAGFVLSAELVLIATTVVLGISLGLSEISSAVNAELFDVARSYRAVNGDGSDDRYGTLGQSGAESESSGADFGGN